MAMRIWLIGFIFIIIGIDSMGQNLIPDPGFELINGCPKLYEFDSLSYWKQASSSAAMYGNNTQYGLLYHKCSGNVPNTGWGYYDTHSGEGMGSIIAMFIYTPLKETLEKDKSYRCSFWLRVGTKTNIGCWWQTYDNKISLFSFNEVPLDTVYGPIRKIPIYTWNIVEKYDTSWVRFECCFKAKGDEKFIGFGYKDSYLSVNCDNIIDSSSSYRPPFLTVTISNAFRQLPFFIDDIEVERSDEEYSSFSDNKVFICRDSSIVLNGTNYHEKRIKENVFGYLWSSGEKTPQLNVNRSGKYTVTISEVCKKKQVNFIVQNKNCFCNVYVPNSFSPDGDGVNDIIKPLWSCTDAIVSRITFSVYNRWGNLVFQTKELNSGWDGHFNITPQYGEVFLWVLDYDVKVGNRFQNYLESGDITVMK